MLTIVGKSSILNVAEFLDLPFKTSSWTDTSPISCKNQSFSYYFEMWNFEPLSKVSITFYHMMKYLLFCSLLDFCYHYVVSYYGSSKWLFKVRSIYKVVLIKKVKSVSAVYVYFNFCYPSFLL